MNERGNPRGGTPSWKKKQKDTRICDLLNSLRSFEQCARYANEARYVPGVIALDLPIGPTTLLSFSRPSSLPPCLPLDIDRGGIIAIRDTRVSCVSPHARARAHDSSGQKRKARTEIRSETVTRAIVSRSPEFSSGSSRVIRSFPGPALVGLPVGSPALARDV